MKRIWQVLPALLAMLALCLGGCTLDEPESSTLLSAPTTDEVLASYGSLGNSLTAGFMDGGLMVDGQSGSFPQLIAQQLGIGAADFTQPLVASPGIGSSDVGEGLAAGVLYFDGAGLNVLGATPLADVPGLLLNGTQLTPYHNMGVPGAMLIDVTQAYNGASSFAALMDPTSPNSYFDFINRADTLFDSQEETAMLPDPAGGDDIEFTYQTASMFQQVVAQGSALVTVWIGNNDVLGSATLGNPITGLPPTDPGVFQTNYTNLIMALAGGLLERTGWPATIVLANIPSISTIPYFIPEATFVIVTEGGWPFGYAENNDGNADDVQLVRFQALTWIQDPANIGSEMPSDLTLTTAEVAVIDGAVAAYNAIIAGVAAAIDASGTATCDYVDMNGILAGLTDDQKKHFLFLEPQIGVEAAAATTYFSLDGIHPNNLGYGVVANAFIEKINDMMGTSTSAVDIGTLSWDPTYGVPLPGKSALESGALPVIGPTAARAMDAVFH